MLEIEGRLDSLLELFALGMTGFPTKIDQALALEGIGTDTIQWFVDRKF